MKKVIGAFAAGQTLQLLILFVGQSITYETHLVLFCAVMGTLFMLMLVVGTVIASIEFAGKAEDMEEAAAIPAEIKVENDKVERIPTEEATVDKLFGRRSKC